MRRGELTPFPRLRRHTASILDNGNLLLFDKGDSRPAAHGVFTRLAEYELDMAARSARLVFDARLALGDGRDAYAEHAGSVVRLANGHTLGTVSCDGDGSTMVTECSHVSFEVDASGAEVARLTLPDEGQGRGYRGAAVSSLA